MKKIPRNKCLNCDKFTKRHTTKFCSYDCLDQYNGHKKRTNYSNKKLLRQVCLNCDKQVNRPQSKYCSKHCQAEHCNSRWYDANNTRRIQIAWNIKICPICKMEFKRKTRSEHMRAKYCSLRCLWDSFKERKYSKLTLKRMSQAATKRNNQRTYTKGVGGTRKDIGHYVRSSWEANICRLLIYLKIDYEFEKHYFKLKDDKGKQFIYTPDYKIYNRFIEVKGWWNEKSLLIKKLMKEQYPDVKITYIDEKVYKRFLKKFANKIPDWEFKIKKQKENGMTKGV